ncbi:MAG TPA: phage tail assembly chaperone [Patescibacteria group bacterium]|nr:MAG: hypothetical protein UR43_C0005G0062 [candidate division TM6 bacterium GW2011_GWF2_33_332]HLD91105.1 phage tail assembly chaperone [Patescibacteria group bacterium]
MKKVIIHNEITNKYYPSKVEDERIDSWLQQQIDEKVIGLPERKLRTVPEELLSRILSQEEKTEEILGETVIYTEYTIKADYVITIEDITNEYNIEQLRNKRNVLLQSTDKYMLSDYPITSEELILMKNYRMYLRDITQEQVLPESPLTFEEFKNL